MYSRTSIPGPSDLTAANSNDKQDTGLPDAPDTGSAGADTLAERLFPLALTATGFAAFAFTAAHLAGWVSLHGALLGASLVLAIAGGAGIWTIARVGKPEEKPLDPALAQLAERLESGLESLADLKWELRESEARYRDLLECQGDIIIRRDRAGALTFVNDVFCETFGQKRTAVLGTAFSPEVLEGGRPDDLPAAVRGTPRRYEQLIETADGPKWFAWEEFAVADTKGDVSEYQCFGRDMSAQRVVESTIEDARKEAETANRAKSRFLASMSHEIRTPMNGILGMTGLLMDTELSPEQGTYARAISTSAKTLLSLIDEILDFSKIEAGKMEISAAPFDLAETVQGVVELLAPRAHDKCLKVGWYIDPSLPVSVTGDEIRIRQILINLMGNAVKFTERGGVSLSVEKAAEPHDGTVPVSFAIMDTGVGIDPDSLETIFSEFEQADASPARRHGGTGLGLAISKRLVEKMGGTLEVKSEPGEGSTFVFSVPLPVDCLTETLSNQWPMPKDARNALVVAHPVESRSIEKLLSAAGCSVTCEGAESAAVEIWNAVDNGMPFDTVVVGYEALDESDGLLAQAREAVGETGSLTSIVMLDPAQRGEIAGLKARGADAYLVRPVRPLSLFSQLHRPASEPAVEDREDRVDLELVSGGPDARKSEEPVHVLLAEDNDINALLATKMLEKAGCSVCRARNGREALKAVVAAHNGDSPAFSLILMDIHMPEMGGVEATSEIRSLYASSAQDGGRPPIVALTANAFPEDREQYLDAGLDDYLAKPFEKEDLQAVLSKWTVEPIGTVKATRALSG